jgi:hypothetical protein
MPDYRRIQGSIFIGRHLVVPVRSREICEAKCGAKQRDRRGIQQDFGEALTANNEDPIDSQICRERVLLRWTMGALPLDKVRRAVSKSVLSMEEVAAIIECGVKLSSPRR